jgi:hypothetical protein
LPVKLLTALLLKLLLLSVLFGALLPPLFGLDAGGTSLAILVVWLASFLAVDAVVVPAAGAATAAVADFALVALILAVLLRLVSGSLLGVAAAAAAIEYGFHVYLLRRGVLGRPTV